MQLVGRIPTLTHIRPLVDESGIATQELRSWSSSMDVQSTIIGFGSPEGVIEAEITAEYMDQAGLTGNIKYIKREIDNGAGDKRFGWILI